MPIGRYSSSVERLAHQFAQMRPASRSGMGATPSSERVDQWPIAAAGSRFPECAGEPLRAAKRGRRNDASPRSPIERKHSRGTVPSTTVERPGSRVARPQTSRLAGHAGLSGLTNGIVPSAPANKAESAYLVSAVEPSSDADAASSNEEEDVADIREDMSVLETVRPGMPQFRQGVCELLATIKPKLSNSFAPEELELAWLRLTRRAMWLCARTAREVPSDRRAVRDIMSIAVWVVLAADFEGVGGGRGRRSV